ncbi:MAG: cell division protein ZapA [Parvularculaceae bacterium]
MAQVEIIINGRAYKVTCEDGQERRLEQLASHLDRHVSDLAEDIGQIGDARLMLLAALTVCDELFDARAKIAAFDDEREALDAATVGGATRVIDAAAGRVEALANRLAEA